MPKVSKINGAIIGISFLLPFFFQNCAAPNESNFDKINASANNTSSSDAVNTESNTFFPNELKINVASSEISKTDCSLPGATFKIDITNASSDILLCQEYVLDMPKGHKRFGEAYKCDGIDKFVKPPSSWTYDENSKVWSKTTAISNTSYVPGDYVLAVKDNSGIKKSNILKIRHYGFENCSSSISKASNSNTPVISCSWSGEDFSPATPPATTCTQAKSGKSEMNANGVQYTCLCNQIKNDQTLPISPGSSGGGTSLPQKCIMNTNFKITSVDIGTMGSKSFPRTNFYPDANGIYSFAVKTPNSSQLVSSQASAVPLVSATYSKLLVLSECPGDIATANKEKGCWAYGADGSSVEYNINATVNNRFRCSLKPNTQYYLNVAPISPEGVKLCSSSKNCGFSFITK